MKIYDKKGTVVLDIPVEDTSYRYRAIRQGDKVFLYFSLTDHIEIPIYSYIEFMGQRYTLWRPENLTKHGTRNLEYTVEFGGWWEILNRTRYKLLASKPHKIKFPLTATPRIFIQLLVDNLNLHDSGWKVGTCIEATEKAMTFNNESCMAVLNRCADEFKTEFEFINKTVYFSKVEKFKENPLPLSYGKGNGFKTGIARQNQGDKAPVTILYVQGGERNIDPSAYGSTTLLLPKSQVLEYQGRRYKTDPDGMYITRADRELAEYNEDSYDGSNHYPSRVGTISEVVTVNAEKNFYDIKDSTIPEALDYSQCRIAGEKAVVIFQTGILTGKEFEIEQTDKALTGYVHAERRFKIVPEEKDGTIMPNKDFCPSVGDKYAIFNIALPDAYVNDNTTKSGASWDMFREAVQYMYENEDQNFTFRGELDGIWSKKSWYEIGAKITPGGYVQFSDTQFQKEGLLIRITGVKDYINKPHAPELELSNTPVAGFVSSELGKIDSNEVKDEERHKEGLSFTKRRFRDAEQALTMLEKAVQGYSEGINPIWIKSMAALFGDETLQFRFVNNKTNPSTVGSGINFNNDNMVLTAPLGIIQHMSIGVNTLSPSHKASEYKFWDMAAYTSPALDEPDAMYIYAKCSKTTTQGTFLLSKTAKDFDNLDGNYYLLIGILSDEYEGYRSYVECYGFTEILPGRITLWKIVDPDGFQYWDMQNQAFRIGNPDNYLAYNVDGLRRFMLKGIMVQSPSGEIDYLEVDRGQYVTRNIYYPGDKVSYGGNVYKCIQTTTGTQVPTNTAYWKVLVTKGADGKDGIATDGKDGVDGKGYVYAYYPSNNLTPPKQPPGTSTGNTPSGWWDYPDFNGYRYIYVMQAIYENGKWSEWSTPTLHSQKSEAGPGIVFRGEFGKINTPRIFYNNAARRDVIKHNGTYYIFRGNDGETHNTFNAARWENFGAQFSSVATELLLAESANIGGWAVRDELLESQTGGAYLNGKTGEVNITGRFESSKDGNRIAISPNTKAVQLINADGTLAGLLNFNLGSGTLSLFNRPTANGVETAVLSANTLRFQSKPSNSTTYNSYYGLNFMQFDAAYFPTKDRLSILEKGTLYRDGDVIKMKIT